MRLTPHFALEEFLVSEIAARNGIDNTPGPAERENLQVLAVALEEIRVRLGKPIIITSGYRTPELNAATRGSENSAHMWGLAADFICFGYGPPLAVCTAIASMDLPFDQLINEFGGWVHFGLPAEGRPYRRQLLTARRVGESTVYLPGLLAVAA